MRALKGKEYKDFNWNDIVFVRNSKDEVVISSRSTGNQLFHNKDTSIVSLEKTVNRLKDRYNNKNITEEYDNIYKIILNSNISAHAKTELARVIYNMAIEDGSTCHFDGNPTIRIKELFLVD